MLTQEWLENMLLDKSGLPTLGEHASWQECFAYLMREHASQQEWFWENMPAD